MIKTFSMTEIELQQYLNKSFLNTMRALQKEKYLTKKECDEIVGNYSIVIESQSWMLKSVCEWLGFNKDDYCFRLMRAVDREANEGKAK